MGLTIIDSARKHGISDEDIFYVISHAIEVIQIEAEPENCCILVLTGLCGFWK
jgi:hypothetical protein